MKVRCECPKRLHIQPIRRRFPNIQIAKLEREMDTAKTKGVKT
jgi:hypothetical protein